MKNGVVTKKEVSQIPAIIKKLPRDTTVYIDDAHASSSNFAPFDWESLTVDLNQSDLARGEGAPNWDLSKLEVEYLNQNYRSTPEIVSYLQKLSDHIQKEDETQQILINAPAELLRSRIQFQALIIDFITILEPVILKFID